MFDEVQIEPMLFHGPGACPNCLTPLILAEKELTVMDLDKNGNVIIEPNYDVIQIPNPFLMNSFGAIISSYSDVFAKLRILCPNFVLYK